MLAVGGCPLTGWSAEPLSAVVESGPPVSLEEALRSGLQNHPELRAARARVDVAAGKALQARTWSNPELELSAEDWPVHDGFSSAKQMIGVQQTLPWPGKKRLEGEAGALGVRAHEADLLAESALLIRDIRIAFYRRLAAERLVLVSEDLVKVAELSASAARKRSDAGAIPLQEQLRAEIQADQARNEASLLVQELGIAQKNFETLTGIPQTMRLVGELEQEPDLSILNRDPDSWLPTHPKVKSMESRRTQAETESKRARLELYPDVKVGLAGGREGPSGDGIIELRVSVPLPILDRSKGRKLEAKANAELAGAEVAVVKQQLLREWSEAIAKLRSAAAQTASYREHILPKADEALRLVRTGFEQGKFGFTDLVDIQRTTAEARLAYLQRLLELRTAEASLEALCNAAGEVPALKQ